jgi:ABC-type Na+ efflux pump permease subunit
MEEHRGPAIAVAAVAVTFFALMAGIIVALGWVSLTVYAVVKMIGSAPDQASPTTVVLIFVGLVTVLAVALSGLVLLAGKSMATRKRRDATTTTP